MFCGTWYCPIVINCTVVEVLSLKCICLDLDLSGSRDIIIPWT